MIRRDLLTGHWKPYLERAISLKPCYEGGINGGEVAAHILQEIACGKNYASDKFSGARRLRDANVLGYQLQRVPGRAFSRCTDDFEILHGDLQGLPDTKSFSKRLAELDTAHESE
ncbi:L-arabinokinase [Populus trichocarpa]|uniref:L-arabinokinase n=1 Tax=Populus trichocarpa TaxID=3694 RepID=UPI000D18AD54|nr:L-arabinokinase [Populus trichocarpa]|eukprot:XP_024446089.1 L-arabinokinase [Populus trichocarpa]